MAVDVGSAVGYLDLDISGFIAGLQSAQSQANKSLNKIEAFGNKVTTVGNKISTAGKTLTKTVTAPIIGLGTAAVTTAANFESAMSEVAAISGATGNDLAALSDKAKEMGASTKFSASEAADAFKYMAMAGWKTEDMLSGIEGVLNLAAASGEDLGTTSDIVTDALTAFDLTAADSAHFADVLATASSNANTNVALMGETFKYAAPVAGALGYTVEDTAEAIGLMANAGIKGSQAGTALRAIMNKLTGEIKLSGKALGDVTIQTTNADGSMRELNAILDDCRSAFSQLSESEQASAAAALVGQEAMSGFLSLMNAAPADIDKLRNAISEADGTAAEMAATMQDNLSGQLTMLKSAVEGIAISFGELMLPVIKDVVTLLQGLAEKINNLDEGQKEMIIRIATIVAVVGPVLLVVGKLVSGFGSLATGIGKVTSLFGGFTSAASSAAGPATSAGAGIGSMAKSALNLLAAGAGIMLAATGLALLAQSSIALANAGWPAIAVMGGLVVALVGLAAGAAAIAPALTAGSVGLIAFGGAIALVGVGVLAATGGVALLATQLPTIATHGSAAAGALVELGGALVVFSAGALSAGGGCLALAGGLAAVGAGALVAAAGAATLSVGVLALSAGVLALGAGLTLCGAGMTLLAATSGTATAGLTSFTAAASAAFVPITAGAASLAVLDAACLASIVTFGLLTVELAAAAVSAAALSAAMVATAASVTTINGSASSAAKALTGMVKSVDVVKTGLNGLESVASTAVNGLVNAITGGTPSAGSAALALGTEVATNAETGMAPMVPATENIMSGMNSAVSSGMSSINSTIRSGFASAVSYIKSLAGQAPGWGADIIQGIASGINSNLGTLSSAVNAAANIIRSRLHFSVPDEGPLTDYESWMPDFMQGLARGITDNRQVVRSAIQDVSTDLVVKPEYAVDGMFSAVDNSNLENYNITLINTLGIYKQLVEQMRMCSEYSLGYMPMDNGLMRPVKPDVDPVVDEGDDKRNEPKDNKPDQLVIPITIGEEQLETVVVDLLRREVRT